jgi:hypothetical protein
MVEENIGADTMVSEMQKENAKNLIKRYQERWREMPAWARKQTWEKVNKQYSIRMKYIYKMHSNYK